MVARSILYGRRSIRFTLKMRETPTLSITVLPDGQVEVIAPFQADERQILQRVSKRARWISRQQLRFGSFLPEASERPKQTGQSIRYLGRQYRVRAMALTQLHRRTVVRSRNVLEVRLHNLNQEEALRVEIDQWWHLMAKTVIAERFERCLALMPGIKPPKFSVRKMAKRWGSFTASGRILLNPELIAKPVDCIDYVIIHELCHVKHPNHQRGFYQLLNRVLRDWKTRKARLENCEV